MLFITIRSASAAEVSKVLRVVEETKRLRYKSGELLLFSRRTNKPKNLIFALEGIDEELHQYVSYDTVKAKGQGPRRINLDDPAPKGKNHSKDAYTPPESLIVHLSKIDMPELRPRAEVKDPGPELGWVPEGTIVHSPFPATSSSPSNKSKGKGKDE